MEGGGERGGEATFNFGLIVSDLARVEFLQSEKRNLFSSSVPLYVPSLQTRPESQPGPFA